MANLVVVTVIAADPEDIHRTPSGAPVVRSDAAHAQLFLATPSGSGWTVETWTDQDSVRVHGLHLVTDTVELAASVATAVRSIADSQE